MSNNPNVTNPPHYTKHPSGVECIQITEHMNFNLGNAVKYIWRAGEKGELREDLEKAIWYLQREIERTEASDKAKAIADIEAERIAMMHVTNICGGSKQ